MSGEEGTDAAKLMEMFVKAMAAFTDKEKDKPEKRNDNNIFHRDYPKNIKEFNASKEDYNGWSFKLKMSRQRQNPLFFDVIKFIERKTDDLSNYKVELTGLYTVKD